MTPFVKITRHWGFVRFLQGLSNSQASCTVRARLKHAKQEQGRYQYEGDPGRDDTAEDRYSKQFTMGCLTVLPYDLFKLNDSGLWNCA